MKEKLTNIIERKSTIEDLIFIVNEYVKINKEKELTSEELIQLVQVLRTNPIMINNMINNIIKEPQKYNLEITTLLDKDKNPIKYYINDIK